MADFIAVRLSADSTMVANVADLLDRQLALIVDARYNHGLPANLSGAKNDNFHKVPVCSSSCAAKSSALGGNLPLSSANLFR